MSKPLNRPIAPHLTIYLSQQSSLFSIWHRLSAIMLIICIFIYFFLQKMFFWLHINFITYNLFYSYFILAINPFNKFFVLIVTFYHTFNGLRHILWDLGLLLSTKTIKITNITILITIFFFSFIHYTKYCI